MHDEQRTAELLRAAPPDADRRVAGCAINPVDLWEVVRVALQGRSDVVLPEFDPGVAPDAGECAAEDFERFVADLAHSGRIEADGASYQITYGFHADDDESGGAAVHVTELRRDAAPVLMSISRRYFISTGDDDHETARQDDLYLIDASDPIGGVVFPLLSRRA